MNMVSDGVGRGRARRLCGRGVALVWVLALMLAGADPAAASDPERLRAVTVKITVQHSTGSELGSGILLCQRGDRVDVLTAKHVVTGMGLKDESGAPQGRRFDVHSLEIAFYRDSPFPVRASPSSGEVVVKSAELKDLALVTLSGVEARLRTARLGSSTSLSTGDRTESVGHALDVDWDWADGSVRTVGEVIRHSANADRGYSGGPLFNTLGEVVGINLQKLRGVARAMPIEEALLTVRRWIDPGCLEEGGPDRQREIVRSSPPPPPKAGERKLEQIQGVEFAWRFIPRGMFRMGSPPEEVGRYEDETLHKVTLKLDFLIGETEVTQGQWQTLMGTNPARFPSCGALCPVESVNWYEALAFANALSRASGLPECYELSGSNGKKAGEGLEFQKVRFHGLDCQGYRLPTEAEWEYAARAKTRAPYWFGESLASDQANCDTEKIVEVRSFGANPWGLYDVHGNVYEWTQDAAKPGPVTDTYKDGVVDPLSKVGSLRVIRGGGFGDDARSCRAAYRIARPPVLRSPRVGFRVLRTLP